ncbi:MAG TPA: VCBS repeat-containing protein, partial [Verrucomicrobiota bacterium]|nr:VCBS repeat-containing protein [Verrucomicrobiota bacterium]
GGADGDGLLDLALSGRSNGGPVTHVYRNLNGSQFVLWQALDPVEYSALAWADFDNDGDLDLIVSGYQGNRPLLRLYQNQDGRFVRVELWSDPFGYYLPLPDIGRGALAWADFDGDGDLDLFITGDQQNYQPSTVRSPTPPYPGYVWPPGVGFSPFQSRTPYRPAAQLYRNDGPAPAGRGWLFRPMGHNLEGVIWDDQTISGGMIAQAEWCDLDADGRLDLVLSGYQPNVGDPRYAAPVAWVFRNEGPDPAHFNGLRFTRRDILPVNRNVIQTLTCADWDNDGVPDLLMSGHANGSGWASLRILHNRGLDFSLTSHLQAATPQGMRHLGGPAAFGHFLGNPHRLDAAVSGMWGWISATVPHDSAVRVFLPPPGENAPPSLPTNLAATIQGHEIRFAWSAAMDDTTPQIALTYNLSVERVDGQPGGLAAMADLQTGRRRVERGGNVGRATTWTLRNLPPGEYRWRVPALDAALTPSGFATAAQTFVAGPIQPPGGSPPPVLSQWIPSFGGLTTADLQGVIEARQVRFAVGRRGRILYAPRGQPFTAQDVGVQEDLYAVAMGPDAVIAVGNAGVILRSEDGWNWTQPASPGTGSLRCITHGAAGWVALGEN